MSFCDWMDGEALVFQCSTALISFIFGCFFVCVTLSKGAVLTLSRFDNLCLVCGDGVQLWGMFVYPFEVACISEWITCEMCWVMDLCWLEMASDQLNLVTHRRSFSRNNLHQTCPFSAYETFTLMGRTSGHLFPLKLLQFSNMWDLFTEHPSVGPTLRLRLCELAFLRGIFAGWTFVRGRAATSSTCLSYRGFIRSLDLLFPGLTVRNNLVCLIKTQINSCVCVCRWS